MGIWHCAAPRTNSSRHASSSNVTWSPKGRLKKAGTFFTHLTDIKRMRAAASQMASGLFRYAVSISWGYWNRDNQWAHWYAHTTCVTCTLLHADTLSYIVHTHVHMYVSQAYMQVQTHTRTPLHTCIHILFRMSPSQTTHSTHTSHLGCRLHEHPMQRLLLLLDWRRRWRSGMMLRSRWCGWGSPRRDLGRRWAYRRGDRC